MKTVYVAMIYPGDDDAVVGVFTTAEGAQRLADRFAAHDPMLIPEIEEFAVDPLDAESPEWWRLHKCGVDDTTCWRCVQGGGVGT